MKDQKSKNPDARGKGGMNVEHRTSNIQHRMKDQKSKNPDARGKGGMNVEHRTSNIQHRMKDQNPKTPDSRGKGGMNVERRTSNVQHPTSNEKSRIPKNPAISNSFCSFGGVVEKFRFSIQRSMFQRSSSLAVRPADATSPASPASCLLILFLASCILHPVSCILQ
jgi:hypothetical protein